MDYTLTFAALIGVFLLLTALRRKSSLRTVPGPVSPSWIFGHMLELMDSPTGCLEQERLVISDPVALQYIIKSANFHHAQRKDAANVALYGAKSVTSLRVTFGVEELDHDLVGDILKIRPRSWPGQSKSEMLIDGMGARFPIFFRAATLYLQSFNLLRKVQVHATQVGRQILQEKIAAIESGTVDLGHDLFTKLLANNSSSRKKLTDEEIAEQTSVFLVAGHETTAECQCGRLQLELGRNPEFQQKLREELNSRQGDVVYDSLPLLNAFIKEVLRVYPAAALHERVALKDEIIPLSEGIVTTTGQRITQIPICKGDLVMLAIASYQRLQSLWGDDADSFNPYRWIDGKIHEGEAIGPYANLLSFLGGPHVCPGWRFAVLEMQVILAELIRKFSFTLPANEIVRVKLSNTLQPTDSSGQKCVCLYVA
ncbi:cytochrome P450 [Mycena latifolia]|nr:cytochrome P450 [Mycena latifolia]